MPLVWLSAVAPGHLARTTMLWDQLLGPGHMSKVTALPSVRSATAERVAWQVCLLCRLALVVVLLFWLLEVRSAGDRQ